MKKPFLQGSTVLFCFFLLMSLPSFSQNESDEHALIHFDNGIGFFAPDKNLSMSIHFRMQNRIEVATKSADDLNISEVNALVKRMRLRFDGFVLSKDLTYTFQLGFTRYDQDWDKTHFPNILRDAMVYYRFNDKFYMGFGQGKLPGNRQRVTSSGQLQFIDRSNANNIFNIDRDFGLFAYYSLKLNNVAVNLKGALSSGDGRNESSSNDGLAYTGRIEILPFGNFTEKGDYSEGDLKREQTPKLSIAGAYSFNVHAHKSYGEFGCEMTDQKNIESAFADILFKYKGFSVCSEYLVRNCSNPFSYSPADSASLYVYTGNGFYAQTSYLFKNNYEIAGRYSFVKPDNKISSKESETEYYTLGLTKYIKEHRVKLQANVSYKNILKSSGNSANWIGQVQIELGI
jgi:phosphate-selective porin OprO and OprP